MYCTRVQYSILYIYFTTAVQYVPKSIHTINEITFVRSANSIHKSIHKLNLSFDRKRTHFRILRIIALGHLRHSPTATAIELELSLIHI